MKRASLHRLLYVFSLVVFCASLTLGGSGCNCGSSPGLENNPNTDGGTLSDGARCPAELTPCSNDEACQTCGASLICIAGQCSKDTRPDRKPDESKPDIPPSKCPTVCSSHDDCRTKECGERTECVNGVCSYPPRNCPSECKEDAECQTPSCGSRIRCDRGRCEELPACPASCTDDQACAEQSCGPRSRCIEGACKVPPSNEAPLAVAERSQKVQVGSLVQLDGSQSKDPDGDKITFLWSFVSKPQGSLTDFNDSTIEKPAFVPDREGEYVIQLVVNDGQVDSKPSTVRISAAKEAQASPVLSSLSPPSITEGTTVSTLRLFGQNFSSSSKVSFRGVFQPTTFVNATELSIALPAALPVGDHAVFVENSDGQKTQTLLFRVLKRPDEPPVLFRLDPASVQANTAFSVSAFGEKFISGARLYVDGKAVTTTFVNSTQLNASVGALAAGRYSVYVENPDGKVSGKLTILVAQPGPVLTSLQPSTFFAKQNFSMALIGDRFVTGATVLIGSQSYLATFKSAKELTISLSIANPGDYTVTVKNPDGQTSNVLLLKINPALTQPIITALNPAKVRELTSTTIEVRGNDFVNGAKVLVGGQAYPTSFVSKAEVRVTLPATIKAGSYPVQLINPDNQKSNTLTLTLEPRPPAPQLTSIDPTRVAEGTTATITLKGNNFIKGAQIQIGPRLYPSTFVSATELTVSLPNTSGLKAGDYPVAVFNPDSQKSNAINLTIFKLPPPKLDSITPNSGVSNTALTVVLKGDAFAKGAKAIFQGGGQTTTFVSATELQMTLSLGNLSDGSYSVWVQNPDGQISQKLPFKVTAPQGPQAKQILPNKGATDTKVNIILDGSGFVTGATISLDTKVFKTTFINDATLGATFDLTGVAAGTYPVTVKNPDGKVSNTVYFTVSATKQPAPELITVNPTKLSLRASPPIYLSGKYFQNGALLMLPLPIVGAVGLPANYINANTLVVTTQLPRIPIPFPAQNVQVYVRNPDGQDSNRKPMQVSP